MLESVETFLQFGKKANNVYCFNRLNPRIGSEWTLGHNWLDPKQGLNSLPHKPTYAATFPKHCPLPLLEAVSVTPRLSLHQPDCTCQTSPHINLTRSIHCQSWSLIDAELQTWNPFCCRVFILIWWWGWTILPILPSCPISVSLWAIPRGRKLPNQWKGCGIKCL